MNFRKLSYPIVIAQEASLTKAAERLFLTPSALSQFINKEEESLGIQLFVRTREKWVPTYAGEVYIEAAKRILEINDNTERILSEIIDNRSGRFTVGMTPGRMPLFSAVFPSFYKIYPGVSIHLIEANWQHLQRLMLDNSIDMAITMLHDQKHQLADGLEAEILAEEEFILYVPKTHPKAKLYAEKGSCLPLRVDLKDFENDSFIGFSKEITMYKLTNELFRNLDMNPTFLFESASSVTVKNLALNGFGIAILSGYYAEVSDKSVYFKINPPTCWSVAAITREGFPKSKAMNYFLELCKTEIENSITDLNTPKTFW